MITIEHVQDIIKDSYDLWLDGLFVAVKGFNNGIGFEKQKEQFFILVERLLNEEIIKFVPPNELWHEGYDIWDADTKTIVNYLKERFPEGAID